MEILNKKKILTCVISAWNETVVSKIWFVLFDLHYLRSIELYRFFLKGTELYCLLNTSR